MYFDFRARISVVSSHTWHNLIDPRQTSQRCLRRTLWWRSLSPLPPLMKSTYANTAPITLCWSPNVDKKFAVSRMDRRIQCSYCWIYATARGNFPFSIDKDWLRVHHIKNAHRCSFHIISASRVFKSFNSWCSKSVFWIISFSWETHTKRKVSTQSCYYSILYS